jgi:hypothetical protein
LVITGVGYKYGCGVDVVGILGEASVADNASGLIEVVVMRRLAGDISFFDAMR